MARLVSLFNSGGEFLPSAAVGTRTVRVTWDDMGYDSYNVGYDDVTHASENRNDVSIYETSINVGTGTSDGAGHRYYDITGWPSGSTCYFAVNGVVGGEVGPWGTEANSPPP